MRRITVAVMSTLSSLVLLFSYHTSTKLRGRAGRRWRGGDREPDGR